MPNICSQHAETLGKYFKENLANSNLAESFDISGKVDTNNPIYKFYEKDMQKYLNKFGGKRIVDAQGVSWVEVPINKEYAKQPVEAFGKIAKSPLFIGALATGALAGASKIARTSNNTEYVAPQKSSATPTSESFKPSNDKLLNQLRTEVAYRESRGAKEPYTAVNKNDDGTSDYGKYQVNEQTLETYGKKILGKEVSPDEFLANPSLQEKFFEGMMKHFQKLGAKSIPVFLTLWHYGSGNINAKKVKEIMNKPEVKAYLNTKPQ